MAQIDKPNLYFTTNTYTGTSGNQTFNLGFQPDWIWTKNKNSGYNHVIVDAVRGNTKVISSNNTTAEGTCTEGITSFTSTGYTIGANTSSGGFEDDFNGTYNSPTYVSWNWKANGSGSSNTDGSITATVSANTTSGFSIVKYTGTGSNATVGHGLGAAPKMVIVRRISPGGEWYVHAGQLNDNEKVLVLNTTAANANASTVFNNTAPTSSVFSLGTNGDANGNTYEHIAYCFAEKKGYSKFGKYIGNGNADGTFVYTGFKPAFVILKCSSAVSKWLILDNKRPTSGSNPNNARLFADVANAESTSSDMADFYSNGFKLRTTDTDHNANNATNIYMAFAENPIVGSNNVPATAE